MLKYSIRTRNGWFLNYICIIIIINAIFFVSHYAHGQPLQSYHQSNDFERDNHHLFSNKDELRHSNTLLHRAPYEEEERHERRTQEPDVHNPSKFMDDDKKYNIRHEQYGHIIDPSDVHRDEGIHTYSHPQPPPLQNEESPRHLVRLHHHSGGKRNMIQSRKKIVRYKKRKKRLSHKKRQHKHYGRRKRRRKRRQTKKYNSKEVVKKTQKQEINELLKEYLKNLNAKTKKSFVGLRTLSLTKNGLATPANKYFPKTKVTKPKKVNLYQSIMTNKPKQKMYYIKPLKIKAISNKKRYLKQQRPFLARMLQLSKFTKNKKIPMKNLHLLPPLKIHLPIRDQSGVLTGGNTLWKANFGNNRLVKGNFGHKKVYSVYSGNVLVNRLKKKSTNRAYKAVNDDDGWEDYDEPEINKKSIKVVSPNFKTINVGTKNKIARLLASRRAINNKNVLLKLNTLNRFKGNRPSLIRLRQPFKNSQLLLHRQINGVRRTLLPTTLFGQNRMKMIQLPNRINTGKINKKSLSSVRSKNSLNHFSNNKLVKNHLNQLKMVNLINRNNLQNSQHGLQRLSRLLSNRQTKSNLKKNIFLTRNNFLNSNRVGFKRTFQQLPLLNRYIANSAPIG